MLLMVAYNTNCFTCIILTAVPGVTIGFDSPVYSVGEDNSSVSATVSIHNGTLARNVAVTVYTMDATAQDHGE